MFSHFLFNYSFKILLLIILISWTAAILKCGLIEDKVMNQFFLIKSCRRFNKSIIARANLNSFSKCVSFAVEKKGLAINFSPYKERQDDEYFFANCEVLACPDVDNLTNLVNDSHFDYYSLYGNTEAIYNASCVPNIGVFQVNLDGENYTKAENICRTTGGNLAHILTESRTSGLANVLSQRILDWYKAAYIGLNDMHQEGVFVTALDEPLNCYRYRAWAPGHPRPKRRKDDCVIIDADKTWRVVNCAKKLPFICEVDPKPPYWKELLDFNNGSCSDFKNRTMRKKCKKILKKYKKFQKPVEYDEEEFLGERCDEL